MRRGMKRILIMSGLLFLLTACQKQTISPNDETVYEENSYEDNQESLVEENIVADESLVNVNGSDLEDVLEITEKMYVTYINEIYTNTESYLGKKIKLEGMCTSAYEESTGETYYFVYRTGPGCCGNDGNMCGFEFTTSGDIPEENAWIEVEGTLDSYEQDGYIYLTLRDSQVTVKTERGQEVVYQ